MPMAWNGLGVGLSNLWRIADAETRSISPENFTGEPGRGGMAVEGTGAPYAVGAGAGLEDLALGAHRAGRGVRPRRHHRFGRHPAHLADADRRLAQPDPADVLGRRSAARRRVPARRLLRPRLGPVRPSHSLAVCVNPGSAFNCYWEMPFSSRARITLTNEGTEQRTLYYQIDYSFCDVPDDAARFCAQFRRVNPLPKGDVVTILDGVSGRGHYVGTACCVGCEQRRMVGRGRGQVLHRRRRRVPDDLRDGYRGLLLRVVQLRRRRPVRQHSSPDLQAPDLFR